MQKSLSLINQELKNNSLNNINKKRQIDFQNKIEFKNVSFKYKDRDSYVLKDVNLKINKSDKFLIYGETGSEKSTFIELLLGLFNNQQLVQLKLITTM